jgi:hypothetical protein
MSTGFGSYSPWTERQLEQERALLARASANMVGEIHSRRFAGALTRDAAVEVLDMLGLLPADRARSENPALTARPVSVDTPEPAETLSGPRCGECGGPVKPKRKFCSVPCYESSRAPKCGTPYMARKHRQNGEPPCGPCRDAERAKGRQWRADFTARYNAAVAS